MINFEKNINIFFSILSLIIILYYWYKFLNTRLIGKPGSLGPIGNRGLIGPPGKLGITGLDIDKNIINDNMIIPGPQGPPGLMGPPGIQGKIGPDGPTGKIGLTGPVGGIGLTGQPGLTGPKGPRGPAGKNITKNIFLLTKYNDCNWTSEKQCPDNNIISGIDFGPVLKYYCCPTRLYII